MVRIGTSARRMALVRGSYIDRIHPASTQVVPAGRDLTYFR